MTLEDLPFFVEVMLSTISTGLLGKLFHILSLLFRNLFMKYTILNMMTLQSGLKKERGTLLQRLKTVCIPSSGFDFLPSVHAYSYCPGPNNYRHPDLPCRS